MFSQPSNNRLALPIRAIDHVCGSENPLLTVLEYGNYQCPYTAQMHLVFEKMQQRKSLQKHLRFVFRHFPQTDIYHNAHKAAEAAEAANVQGKFWQMHEMLFKHQQALEDCHLVEYAAQLDLDLSQFLKDMTEHTFFCRVQEDLMSGIRSGVTKTPTFFIDGIRYDGGIDLIKFIAVVIEANNSRST